jgi:hypothetical protein
MANRVIIGTCGWSGADWSKRFYPEGLPVKQRLPFYAERFPFVEMIESYYQTPTRRMVEQMVKDVPDDFRFVMVVPRPIAWGEDPSGYELKAFLSEANTMGEKLVRCVAAFDVREPDPRGVRPWEFTHDLIRYRILKLLAKWPKEIPLRIDIGAAGWDDHDLDRTIRGRASWALTDSPGNIQSRNCSSFALRSSRPLSTSG